MRYVCLFAVLLPLLSAQDGAAIYKEKCASCHDMPAGRVPSLAVIKAMSGETICATLTSGSMKSRAEGLSTAEIFSLIGYIAPTGDTQGVAAAIRPTCQGDAAFRPGATAPQWNGWSPSVTNSRFADAASASLAASDVSKLQVKWAFNLGAVSVVRSQPVIVGGRVFLASQTGAVYALDVDTGCTRWRFQAAPGLRGGVTVGEANGTPAVFFSDGGATTYALNAQTGALLWKVRPVDHYATMATSTPRYYKGVIYQPCTERKFQTVNGKPAPRASWPPTSPRAHNAPPTREPLLARSPLPQAAARPTGPQGQAALQGDHGTGRFGMHASTTDTDSRHPLSRPGAPHPPQTDATRRRCGAFRPRPGAGATPFRRVDMLAPEADR
jgi:cytochrome c553